MNPAAIDAASPTPPLVSLLGLSREARGARSMPTDASASLPAAVSPTYAANPLAHPNNIHHTLPPSASSGHPPHHTSHPPLPSLSNTAAFAAIELSVIQLIESSPNLDLEWADAVSPESPNAMPLAAATSWLQSKFPALCDADAIRLAFQRAAQSSDSFTAECRGSDGTLQPGDLADFIMRALYCHRSATLAPSTSTHPIPFSRAMNAGCTLCVILFAPQRAANRRRPAAHTCQNNCSLRQVMFAESIRSGLDL